MEIGVLFTEQLAKRVIPAFRPPAERRAAAE